MSNTPVKAWTAVALHVVLAVACTPADLEPRSQSETYDQNCDVDSDCVVVAYAACMPCSSCGDLAINTAEDARFNRDNVLVCPPQNPVLCGACPDLVARCTDGTCTVVDCSVEACP